MSAPTTIKLDLKVPIQPIDAPVGTEIVLKGTCTSRHDGSIIDAATTTWPAESPGGARIDPIGMLDLESGGLHLKSRDTDKHEVHAVVQDSGGEACAAAGVSSSCLVLNRQIAVKRLMTMEASANSLDCSLVAEIPPPAAPPFVPAPAVPYLQIAAGILVGGFLAMVAWRWKKGRDGSPEGQLVALSRKVKAQLERADQVVAAPLKPTVDAAMKAIREKRVDASSKEGKRVADALRRVNERLDATMREEQAAKEQEAADELLREMESALEAAEEMKRVHR
jgi:hypothetical protein